MSETETNEAFMIGKEHAADRLMRSQKLEPGSPYLCGERPPTPNQVGAVLHALADHTLLEHLLVVAPGLGADRADLGPIWATTTGLGRALQRMGNWVEPTTPPTSAGSEREGAAS